MKILVVDDHKMFRESVVSFLEREEFCDQVDAAGSVDEAQRLIVESAPDVVLVDLSFPGEGGTALVQWAAHVAPSVACILLSMHEEVADLRLAAAAAARGYVTKNAGYDELRAAVVTVAAGGYYIDQVMLRKLFPRLGDIDGGLTATGISIEGLTSREEEVFEMMLSEMSVSEIGEALYISVKTVENHRSNIYRKLGVHDRMSLFKFAQKRGLSVSNFATVERSIDA
ncbi:MAG: response regulator [Spirochaetales bacterium]